MAQVAWEITGACDKIFYAPGERCVLSIGISNMSKSVHVMITQLAFASDFGNISLIGPDIVVPPNKYELARYEFVIPRNVWGKRLFALAYRMHYFHQNSWRPGGRFRSEKNTYFINVLPQRQINSSRYKVFVSRSIRDNDQPLGDFIAQRLRRWNLETCTVGIEVKATRQDTARVVRDEIRKANGVVAIATPRNYDLITKTWGTLEWLHGEVGISYGIDRPLLIIKQSSVKLEGLPRYLTEYGKVPIIPFTGNEIGKLIIDIDSAMPSFREWVKEKHANEFFGNLATTGIIILAGIGLGQVLKNAFDGFKWTQYK